MAVLCNFKLNFFVDVTFQLMHACTDMHLELMHACTDMHPCMQSPISIMHLASSACMIIHLVHVVFIRMNEFTINNPITLVQIKRLCADNEVHEV